MMSLMLVAAGCAPAPPERSAIAPAPNAREPERLAALAERAREAEANLVFLGDSLTMQWETAGREVWERYYGDRRALNLGVGWERTENVLWRIEQGHLDPLRPKLVVLLIGTNNTEHGGDGPREIADGVTAVVRALGERMPGTQVLLLGIFPRGRDPGDPFRANNRAANELIAGIADGETVVYRDIGEAFVGEDGRIPRELMPDFLHLSARGYALWAEAIEDDVRRLLGVSR